MWTAFLTFTDGGATVPLMMLTMFLPVGHSLGFRLVSNFYGNPAMSLASTSILAFASFVWGTWMVYASVSSSIFLLSDSILQQIWWFRAQVFNAPDFKVTLTIPTALWPYLMNVIFMNWSCHMLPLEEMHSNTMWQLSMERWCSAIHIWLNYHDQWRSSKAIKLACIFAIRIHLFHENYVLLKSTKRKCTKINYVIVLFHQHYK